MTIDTAMNDFNSGQFKVRMEKMTTQVNFYLYPNAFLSSKLFGAWKLAHICQIKALLTTYYLLGIVLLLARTFVAKEITARDSIGRAAENKFRFFEKYTKVINMKIRLSQLKITHIDFSLFVIFYFQMRWLGPMILEEAVFDETRKWPTLGRRSWGNPLYFDSIFTVVESRSRNWGYYQSSRKSNILLT